MKTQSATQAAADYVPVPVKRKKGDVVEATAELKGPRQLTVDECLAKGLWTKEVWPNGRGVSFRVVHKDLVPKEHLHLLDKARAFRAKMFPEANIRTICLRLDAEGKLTGSASAFGMTGGPDIDKAAKRRKAPKAAKA